MNSFSINSRKFGFSAFFLLLLLAPTGKKIEGALPIVENVETQPFFASMERLIDSMDYVGAPVKKEDLDKIKSLLKKSETKENMIKVQKILDQYCLAGVNISAESRVKVATGDAKKELMQQGWRTFLVKVHNKAEITPKLLAQSPNAGPIFIRSKGSAEPKKTLSEKDQTQRFLSIEMFNKRPMSPILSGLKLEYRIIQLYSRDAGKREAKFSFNVGQGTQDIGFRNSVSILFNCLPAVKVVLNIKDHDGEPTTASFVIRDSQQRVYPNPARRLAPDFFFHNQIYRADGEFVYLPGGSYTITTSRGPEYQVKTSTLLIPDRVSEFKADFKLERWIHPASRNWFSGDHHVHAAGCMHYQDPTQGVEPADMMKHLIGEDLNVGCVLTWGPCWYYQKKFFEGKVSSLSNPNNLMRYDVEVSGFPSGHSGHLCLLRLNEDDYPGTKRIEDWPSWTYPILKWGKEQGGVVGYSHSGWGLALPDYDQRGNRVEIGKKSIGGSIKTKAADQLPDYAMPKFDGIGANEYIVTVTKDVCDFISSVDTPSIWELNIWYHALNSGFRTRISGETDFPCIYGDRVGLGRIYVKLDSKENLTFDSWVAGLKNGRSYCGDGLSHVLDFKVNHVAVGEPGSQKKISQLNLDKPQKVKVTCDVSALLEKNVTEKTEAIRKRRLDEKPYWHIERSRIGNSRKVPVELIVNGQVVLKTEIVAD